jgi:hypothetical protein
MLILIVVIMLMIWLLHTAFTLEGPALRNVVGDDYYGVGIDDLGTEPQTSLTR